MANNSLHIINEKLEGFIKRYYWQEIYQGVLIFLGALIALWLVFAFLAYQFYLTKDIRLILFSSFVVLSIALFSWQILLPISKLLNIGKRLSNEQASIIIGQHFSEKIDDKLLNAVQLYNQNQNNELILASIKQKTEEFGGLNFLLAIPVEKLKALAKFATVPLLLVIVCLLWQPKILSQGTERIVAFEKEFVPVNPYFFEFKNKKLSGIRNQEFVLAIEYLGDEIPAEVFLSINGENHRFRKENARSFSYVFNHLNDVIPFKIKAGIHYSPEYNINPIDVPLLQQMSITVEEPKYLGGAIKTVKNKGSLKVPEGSKITWDFKTDHTSNFLFIHSSDTHDLSKSPQLSFRASASQSYQLELKNKQTSKPTIFEHDIEVIKDEYPAITMRQMADSIIPGTYLFTGQITDDYGLSKLSFHYSINDSNLIHPIPIDASLSSQRYATEINFLQLGLSAGEQIQYFFEISDNDGINGPKSSFTNKLTFEVPGKKSIDSLLNKESDELKNLMANAMSKSQNLQKEFKEIKKLMLEKKSLSWQDQQKVQNFLSDQKSLEEDLLKLQKENQQNNEQENILSPKDKEILAKQEQLNKLFEELLDEDTKKMFEELEKLMEELNEKTPKEKLEKINLNNENLEKSLDRTLELFKEMEFEKELDETIKDIEKLSKDQEQLQKETEESKKSEREELSKKQEELQKEFKRLQEKIRKLEKQNQELENQKDFSKTNEQEKQVNDAMEKAKQGLQNSKKKSPSQEQKKSSQGLQKMAKKLSKMQQQMQQQQNSEDLDATRQLLENLIFLSLEQEKLLQKTKTLNRFDPQFTAYSKKQKKIQDDAQLIEDSLFALSKRQVSLASFITKEIHEINYNTKKAIEYLTERKSASAAINQQYVMTSANNLALILDESIQNMQNAMMKKKFGQGSCNKPGGSNPKPGAGMKNLQQMLSKQLEQMKKALKEGNKPGKTGKKGKNGEAKSFGKMAAEQNEIKNKLKQLSQQLQQQGKGGLGNARQLQNQLEETEKQLLNKKITPEMIKRQQEILTKLLEAENSMREREYEEKRESKSAKKEFIRNPKDFLEYKKMKISEDELLKIILPSLNLFYKKKVNEYFNALEK